MHGYTGKRLRINLTSQSFIIEKLPQNFATDYIGGRGFNMKTLFDEVPADCDPLGPKNKLIIGVGPLSGTNFSGSARVNFSGKSPQTGILGDSNAGGFFGPEVKFAGYDQIIIEGKAPKFCYLAIKNDTIRFMDAHHLKGLDVWQTNAQILTELQDKRTQIACVGPAAENGVKYAGIFCNLVRAAARTGLGTLLAAKNVKAIAIRGTLPVTIADPPAFMEAVGQVNQNILDHVEYPTRFRLGTTVLVSALNNYGCLSTHHYQTGCFPEVDQISGEHLADTYKTKNKGCFACNIPCSRFYEINEGKFKGLKSEGPEFEGLAGFSSKLGISDLPTTLKCVDLCNRYGIDVISAAECIGFAMELWQRELIDIETTQGLDLSWGNGDAVLALLDQIALRQGFGDLLADGVVAAAHKLGDFALPYAFHVKGLEFFMADPRGIKGYALGLAVASRGGDHLRSEPWFEFTNDAAEGLRRFGTADAAFRLKYRGKGRVVKHYEELCALADSLNVCKNTVVNMEIVDYDAAAKLLSSLTGILFTPQKIQQAAERIINLERLYLQKCGLTRKDDSLPRRFTHEPLPADSRESTGSVVELDDMLDEYYLARGWDVKTGLPSPSKLQDLGLSPLL